MRSEHRCKAHYQGDRCKKERGHDSDLTLNPDKIHESNNARWQPNKFANELHPVQFRIGRQAKRALRAISRGHGFIDDPVKRPWIMKFLGAIIDQAKKGGGR